PGRETEVMPMPKVSRSVVRLREQQAAQLWLRGLTQAEIGDILGLSQSGISRLLARPRAREAARRPVLRSLGRPTAEGLGLLSDREADELLDGAAIPPEAPAKERGIPDCLVVVTNEDLGRIQPL